MLGSFSAKGHWEGYINLTMDCCAKARTLLGKMPIYKTPNVAMITAITEAGENDKPEISLSGSLKYINTVTLK